MWNARPIKPSILPAILTAALVLASTIFTANGQDLSAVRIESVKVSDNLYMLVGRGGNIGLSVGDDGSFLVDDQFAPLTAKIVTAVEAIRPGPIRFLVNTHWHWDHTGGNENLGQGGTIIVAHKNVRERMSKEQFMEAFNNRVPPSPAVALPVITFTEGLTFHWNGEEIEVVHHPNAHTDGDAIIFFRNANAVHMGDTYFNKLYPFIDESSGGSIDGMIAACKFVLSRIDGSTRIIPGHGPLSNRKELQEYQDLLVAVRDRIRSLIAEGKSLDEIVAAKPTADYDAEWGQGFLNPDVWVGIVHSTLVGR